MENQNDQSNQQPPTVRDYSGPENNKPQDATDDYLFYNVMPRNKGQDTLTEPTLKIQKPTDQPASADGFLTFLKKHKFYIFAILTVVVAGPIIYFLATKIASNSYKSQDILVKPSPSAGNQQQNTVTAQFLTPKEWRDKYFPGCQDQALCGDNADPDHDGLTNAEEYKLGTDPNNKDSDNDGLADGDEIHVFDSDPLNAHTAGNPKYTDADNIKGGYDVHTGKKMSPDQIATITAKMQQFGLHEPTLTTLKGVLNSLYHFTPSPTGTPPTSTSTSASSTIPSAQTTSSLPSTLDLSPQAKQDRDAQRSNTIKNIGIALIAYQTDKKIFPQAQSVLDLSNQIKPYLKVATNFIDPINVDPYVYGYTVTADQSDFTLSFFSETQNQLIKKHAADAAKDAQTEAADINDNQRKDDLDSLRTSLLLYSNANISGTQTYVFPTVSKYKTALVPTYISAIPRDPKTGLDYDYEVSNTFNTFTLKAVLENPPAGTTGYMCNQDGCQNY